MERQARQVKGFFDAIEVEKLTNATVRVAQRDTNKQRSTWTMKRPVKFVVSRSLSLSLRNPICTE